MNKLTLMYAKESTTYAFAINNLDIVIRFKDIIKINAKRNEHNMTHTKNLGIIKILET